MSRSIRYLFGLWVGAVVVAALAAFDLLYLMTGKLLLPGEGGVKLVAKNAAIQGLEALIEEVAEGEYE